MLGLIRIGDGDQFSSGFVEINPNSKIPALVDHSVKTKAGKPLRIFESGSILLSLAENMATNFFLQIPFSRSNVWIGCFGKWEVVRILEEASGTFITMREKAKNWSIAWASWCIWFWIQNPRQTLGTTRKNQGWKKGTRSPVRSRK
jgi:glutathione S-transferase